ncbi:hypothetical protein Tco_0412105 [Tanacetum coccineum]
MHQFWFTIKKTKKTSFYEFGLSDKKFLVDVKLFRKILDICPRVPNEEFVAPPSDKDLLAFLIELGYKGLLDHLAKMFVDHMHQPWRTLATIINKCLSWKTSSNDRLGQSRIAILWEDVKSCPTLDSPKSSSITSSYSTLPFLKDQAVTPRQGGSTRCNFMDIVTTQWRLLSRNVRAIPKTMLTEGIKQSETYHTFIKYFTGLIPLKKSIGKGSQGKKSVVTPKSASVEVSDESDPELARRQTGNRRKSKKKFSILADDNIILEPYVTLKLGKSMSLIEAEEEEAARQVHATHERLVTESDPKPARRSTRRRPSDIAFRDTLSVSKKKSPNQSQKLKGIQTMTAEEQLAANTMQAIKASKKLNRS